MKPSKSFRKPAKLKELAATAIGGNDISSSCLYVSAVSIAYAGQYAWISLLIVAGVLFLFRKIYGEVVGALPLNGGAYNALLNTTRKSTASIAAALTILSYMATAVISATEAMKYLGSLWTSLPIIIATVVLLFIFMALVISGITESSKVAIAIFLTHITALSVLVVFSIYFIITHGLDTLIDNFHLPVEGSILMALLFGFSAAMLGVSGFESSANYVEEQAEGVFPKTLKNMWIVVSIFNPLIAFLAIAILPIGSIEGNEDTLLSYMGGIAGGNWLSYVISIDAVLVLSGAVLTSFVGVMGLVERIALDRILPQFLLKKNSRGSSYRIIIIFFILCASVLLVTQGNLYTLAGIYTIAFLCVMILFAIGNVLLKLRRSSLPRKERASWLSIAIAITAIALALIGNIILNPAYLGVFFEYLIPTLLIVFFMLHRTAVLKAFLRVVEYFIPKERRIFRQINILTERFINKIDSQQFVFFTDHDDISILNHVLLYIRENEHARKLKIVWVIENGETLSAKTLRDIDVLDRAYPDIDIEVIEEKGEFGPEIIKKLSKKWNVPINFMFIGSPGDQFPHRLEDLGGVRLII